MKDLFRRDKKWLLAVLAISLLAIYPLFRSGFYPFHDEPHIANLHQMSWILREGQFPPRFVPHMIYEYGYPLFNFYYHLPFYVGSLFVNILGWSLVDSLKTVFGLTIPLSGIAFYLLMRKFVPNVGAAFGAIVYMFTPYRAVDLYVRGAVGELWAFVFAPIVLLSLLNVIQESKLRNVVLSGIAIAGFILSHNVGFFIFFPFILLILLLYFRYKFVKGLTRVLESVLFGLGFSAYYWLPAVREKEFVVSGTPFNPADHFPFLKQLILPSWGYGASVWGPGDGLSFQIGLVNVLAVVLSLILIVRFRRKMDKIGKIVLPSIVIFFIAVALMNIRSLFIWQALPLSEYVQFPWRFLMVTTFFSSIIAGWVFSILLPKSRFIILLLLSMLVVFVSLSYFRPEKQLMVDDEYYLSRFFARTLGGSEVSISYKHYSEDYLPATLWMWSRPGRLPQNKVEISARTQLINLSSTKLEVDIEADEDTWAVINTTYFPGWQATLDGEIQKITIGEPYGNIFIPVPQGHHLLKIMFVDTPVRTAANVFSIFCVLVAIIFGYLEKRRIWKLQ